jgi:CRP/FNR family transcriptional regulator, cyclic AMP receptor protein
MALGLSATGASRGPSCRIDAAPRKVQYIPLLAASPTHRVARRLSKARFNGPAGQQDTPDPSKRACGPSGFDPVGGRGIPWNCDRRKSRHAVAGSVTPLDGRTGVFVARKPGRRKAAFDPKAFLANVGEGKAIAKFRKGDVVFSQGDAADAAFYIQKGRVKLTVISKQGKEAVIAILGPGDFFGEGCLNGRALRIATTIAMDDCLVTRITKAAMIATMHDEPDFSELFMTYLLERNGRIEEDLIDQLFNSSEKRLARLLLLLANFGKEGRPEQIVGKISQETLAEMIGTTRARVSFFMNKFRKLGFIKYNGNLEVHNSLLNVVLYDKSETEPGRTSRTSRSQGTGRSGS